MNISNPTLVTHNIYPDQWRELGFTEQPTKIKFKLTKEQQDSGFFGRNGGVYARGTIFQEDGMIQLTIWDGVEFYLLDDNDNSIGLKIKNGKLISEFADGREVEIATTITVMLTLAPYRNDAAYGRENPAVIDYISLITDAAKILKNMDTLEKLRARIKEDLALNATADSRKGQKRVRVNIDNLE